ncbi:MAG: hypothetical protein FWD73_05840 [Polyangiaceae bacterium]|nr:hypothetical protein [Polyangiaceae bacterium]
MDASPAPPPSAVPQQEPPAYVYAATDIRPRQSREIELCAQAAEFDWRYTGAIALGLGVSEYLNLAILKQSGQPGVRLLGPGMIGFFWGGFLGGGYLSLPKCSPTWAYGPPPEGPVRAAWPMAAAITLVATATAPAMDFIFLGTVKPEWTDTERSMRVFIAMGTGAVGSLLPYLLPPRTYRAAKEIERIRFGQVSGGPYLSYTITF